MVGVNKSKYTYETYGGIHEGHSLHIIFDLPLGGWHRCCRSQPCRSGARGWFISDDTENIDCTTDLIQVKCDGGDDCCSNESYNCLEGEGDCDSDSDCSQDLICGNNNCNGPNFDATDDCCVKG